MATRENRKEKCKEQEGIETEKRERERERRKRGARKQSFCAAKVYVEVKHTGDTCR